MKKKHILATILVIVFAFPALAVFNERNLQQTLSVLRYELKQILERPDFTEGMMGSRHDEQHAQMVAMVKKCNELALILYSQNQDFTFDLTYALQEVSEQYAEFNRQRLPYDDIVSRLDIEIDRYERLIEALRRLPPTLDEIDAVPDSISLSRADLYQQLSGLANSEIDLNSHTQHRHDGVHEDGHHADHDADHHDDHDDEVEMDEIEEVHNQAHEHNAAHEAESGHVHEVISGNSSRTRAASGHDHGHSHEDENSIIGALDAFTGMDIHGHNHGDMHDEDEHDHERPFILDEKGQADRDTCLSYAMKILDMYIAIKEHVDGDKQHYDDMSERLEESYQYAQSRYKIIQKRIFIDGQDNYWTVLSTFPEYARSAYRDAKQKYSQVSGSEAFVSSSAWRGPVVTGFIVFVLIYLGISMGVAQIVMAVLRRKVAKMRAPEFQSRKKGITYIIAVAIFVLSVWLARVFMHQNFFTLASGLLLVYAWLLIATLASLLVRCNDEQFQSGMKLYTPVFLLGLVVITFRIIFIPNKVVNLLFPPVLVLFAIWQCRVLFRNRGKALNSDRIYAWITLALMAVTTVMTMMGYVLLGVQIFIWWLFQLTAIATITAFYDLLRGYEKAYLKRALERYRQNHTLRISKPTKGSYIVVTWLYDMLEMMIVPVTAVLSVPFCIWMASQVFDLEEVCKTVFLHPFLNLADAQGSAVLHLSLFKLVLVVVLYFIFRYLNYSVKSFYRHYKLEQISKESGQDLVHANQVNLTLANNLTGIILWGMYIIICIILLKIPMGALSMVAAGLATGIGLALKDVLNNFIYGIQLMSGRLRVGDFIECDGVRGKVDRISYQSTTVETLEGAVMAFTNSTLFSKNFKNLTRNNSYELVKIPVGVQYGSDVNKVRSILSEALKELEKKDKYGRNVLDHSKGITIAFAGFGDNSVDLVVKQYVLVEESLAYIAKAQEIIYNTLNENGVEIPFPQRDIYIRQIPTMGEDSN